MNPVKARHIRDLLKTEDEHLLPFYPAQPRAFLPGRHPGARHHDESELGLMGFMGWVG